MKCRSISSVKFAIIQFYTPSDFKSAWLGLVGRRTCIERKNAHGWTSACGLIRVLSAKPTEPPPLPMRTTRVGFIAQHCEQYLIEIRADEMRISSTFNDVIFSAPTENEHENVAVAAASTWSSAKCDHASRAAPRCVFFGAARSNRACEPCRVVQYVWMWWMKITVSRDGLLLQLMRTAFICRSSVWVLMIRFLIVVTVCNH